MSNEELVAAIQSGEDERMGELWGQVKKFIAWKAHRIMNRLDVCPAIEVQDLIQTGYFALVDAVKSYKAGSVPFVKWLEYYLKNSFATAAGYMTCKSKDDPINFALSMECPIGEDDAVLADIIPDNSAADMLEKIDDSIWLEQLHKALESALNAIPPQYSEVVRMRFYEGKTLGDIAKKKSLSKERIRQLEELGLQHLRKTEHACNIYPFYDFNFYCGTGLQTFRNRGISVQEQYLIIMERKRNPEKPHQTL